MEGGEKETEKYKNTDLCWDRHCPSSTTSKCKPILQDRSKGGSRSPTKDLKSKSHKQRKCREGKVTRNPFFNYLREFRRTHCEWSPIKIAKEGAKMWCGMKPEQRKKYVDQACGAPKMRRKGRKGRGRSRRGKSRGRHGKRGRSSR